jgi:Ferritin-like domain
VRVPGPAPSGESATPRRTLLGRAGIALLGLSTVAGAGCGRSRAGASAVKRAAPPVRQADVEILNRLLGLERRTVAAYTAGIPLLQRPQAKTAKQFLNEELQHAGELLSLIKAAGGGVGVPRAASYDLGHPSGSAGVLALLHDLERAQIAAYLTAIPRLSPGPVRAAAASILASDAQHITILRLAQGEVAAPSAFVTGSE